MTPTVLGYVIPIGVGLVVSLILVVALGLVLHTGARIRKDPLPLLFFAIIAAVMAIPIGIDRVLTMGRVFREASQSEIGGSFWVTRLLTLVVMALCAERICRFAFRREWNSAHGWPLCVAFFVYALSDQVLSGLLSAHPALSHKAFHAFPVFLAVFIAAQTQPERCLMLARSALLMFFVLSAAAVPVKPTMVIEFGYVGGIPGIPFRYYGLATHANTIGPLAIAFMICLWRYPFASKWLTRSSWLLVSISLLLSQSKTSIATAILLGAYLAFWRYRGQMGKAIPGGSRNLSLALVGAVFVFCAVLGLSLYIGMDSLGALMTTWDRSTGGQLSSLTGRTRIWSLSWSEFLANPIFGYGPSIWGPLYRIKEGFYFASHAHNQFLQSLSSAGLVGGLSLLVYMTMLFVYAYRARVRSEGLSMALFLLLLLRTVTEVPFTVTGVMHSEFFIHLLVVVACVGFAPARKAQGDIVTAAKSRMLVRSQRSEGGRLSGIGASPRGV